MNAEQLCAMFMFRSTTDDVYASARNKQEVQAASLDVYANNLETNEEPIIESEHRPNPCACFSEGTNAN